MRVSWWVRVLSMGIFFGWKRRRVILLLVFWEVLGGNVKILEIKGFGFWGCIGGCGVV